MAMDQNLSARAQAVKQLIRIEYDDAFANRLTQCIPSPGNPNPGGLSPRCVCTGTCCGSDACHLVLLHPTW